jgi:hypothetical protein
MDVLPTLMCPEKPKHNTCNSCGSIAGKLYNTTTDHSSLFILLEMIKQYNSGPTVTLTTHGHRCIRTIIRL